MRRVHYVACRCADGTTSQPVPLVNHDALLGALTSCLRANSRECGPHSLVLVAGGATVLIAGPGDDGNGAAVPSLFNMEGEA